MDTGVRDADAAQATARTRTRRSGWRTAFVAACAASALFLTAVAAWTAYGVVRVDNAVRRVAVSGLVGAEDPAPVAPSTTTTTPSVTTTGPAPAMTRAADNEFAVDPNGVAAADDARFFLLLGVDSRDNHRFAKTQGMTGRGRSDVMILVRIMPGHAPKLLSIPRDFRIKIPGRGREKITHAHAYGGMSLAVSTVSEGFGIPITHVASVNFAGFEKVIQAVDGVQVCLDAAERDRWSDLDLPEGCTDLSSPVALAYARSRHTEVRRNGRWVDDASGDMGRMRRQQSILAGILRKMGTPDGLAKLPGVAKSLDGAVTVDQGLQIGEILDLARSVAANSRELERDILPGDGGMVGDSYQVRPTNATQASIDAFKTGG